MLKRTLISSLAALCVAILPVAQVNTASSTNARIFDSSPGNTIYPMTMDEMKHTHGEFYCGGWCIAVLALGGASLFGAGFYVGWG